MKNVSQILITAIALVAIGCSEERISPGTTEKFEMTIGEENYSIDGYESLSGGGIITIEAEIDAESAIFFRIVRNADNIYELNANAESFIIYTTNGVEYTSRSDASSATLTIDTINYEDQWFSGSLSAIILENSEGGQLTLNNCEFSKITFQESEKVNDGSISVYWGGSYWEADSIKPQGPTGYLAFFCNRKSDGSQLRLLLYPNQQTGEFELSLTSKPSIQFSGGQTLFAWGGTLKIATHDLRARSISGVFAFSGCLTPQMGCTSFTHGSFNLYY